MKYIITIACSLLFLGIGQAQQKPLNTATLDSLMLLLEAKQKLMGSLTIAKGKTILYSRAVGRVDSNETGVIPADTTTQYRIGSITKMFTAVMIMQLVEEKKLKLDATLAEFYPNMPNAKVITIEHLLRHQTGIHNFTEDSSFFGWYTKPQTHEQVLEKISAFKSEFKPGSKTEYSNTNYVLLGYIIEKLTGKTYPAALVQRILRPLELERTLYGEKIYPGVNQARSFKYENFAWIAEEETDMSIPHGAGAIVSTPSDLTQFLFALFSNKLVSEKTRKQMITVNNNYGMGIFSIPLSDRTSYGHNGGIDGFVSSVGFFPDDSICVAFCSNGMNYEMNDFLISVLKIIYNKPYKLPTFTTRYLPTELLQQYNGVYHSETFPLEVTITGKNGVLNAQGKGQMSFELTAESEEVFTYRKAGVEINFKPVSKGVKQTFILKQGGREHLFTRE